MSEQAFEIEEIAKGRKSWSLRVESGELEFSTKDGPDRLRIVRDEPDRIKRVMFGWHLTVELDKRRVFRLEPEAYQAVIRWMGRAAFLRCLLRQRAGFALLIAALWLFRNLSFENGVQLIEYDRPLLAAALSLVSVWGLLAPSRFALAGHAVAWLVVMGYAALHFLSFAEIYWVVWGLTGAWLCVTAIRSLFIADGLPTAPST